MDPRCLLTLTALFLTLGGCALLRPAVPASDLSVPLVGESEAVVGAGDASLAAAAAPPDAVASMARVDRPVEEPSSARPYLDVLHADAGPDRAPATRGPDGSSLGRASTVSPNRSARGSSDADGFVGGIRVFEWRDGRIYDVRTAPLRVTVLTLAPGETVSAKAAGDTVRWQIGESVSGSGASVRTHVLIKPLRTGLETNLVLTTNQRVYLLTLRSGEVGAFNPAVAWDDGPLPARPTPLAEPTLPVDVEAAAPQGPLDARFRIQPQGRAPAWTPTAVFTDGVRTFIALAPDARASEAPALFVRSRGELQLANYRQSDGLIIVDRRFDEAELRVGGSRPQIVRILRMPGAAR